MALALALAERFWKHVDHRGADECWPWRGKRLVRGYGQFWIHGENVLAHRFALVLSGVRVSRRTIVRHTCDNPPCCNQRHLRAGTQRANMLDAARKGRIAVGERQGSARLNAHTIRVIRRAHARGQSARSLAVRFGVHHSTVDRVLNGTRWRSVK